jgi:programmed cell death protein 4
LPDLDLDTPNAYQVVGKFIARAIADEIMAPIYVMSRPGPQDSDAAAMAFAKARGLVSTPQGLARLSHVWGCNGGRSPVDELRSKVSLMLGEFLLTGDMEEAEECTRELHAKQFMHEVVFQAIDLAMDGRSERDMLLLSALLKSLCNSATISAVQLANGWARVILSIEDIQLDNPHAALNLDSFCRVSSFLPRLFCAKAAQLAHQKMVRPYAFVFCSPAPIAFPFESGTDGCLFLQNKSKGGRVRSITLPNPV